MFFLKKNFKNLQQTINYVMFVMLVVHLINACLEVSQTFNKSK